MQCTQCGALDAESGPGPARCAYCRSLRAEPAPAPAPPQSIGDVFDAMRGLSVGSRSVTVRRVDGGAARYEVDGRTYASLDEMPADARAIVAHMESFAGRDALPLAAGTSGVSRTASRTVSSGVVRVTTPGPDDLLPQPPRAEARVVLGGGAPGVHLSPGAVLLLVLAAAALVVFLLAR